MPRKKNSSNNWLDTLACLQSIIRDEYQNGGKLPPVPEMAARLNVAENTYCKALRTVCLHGMGTAARGRAGTIILPRRLRPPKIGVLYPGIKPLLPQLPLQYLFAETIPSGWQTQMLTGVTPAALANELLVLNIDALYAIKPVPRYFPMLQQLCERSFPVALVLFDNYAEVEEMQACRLPVFHIAPDRVAQAVGEFCREKGYDSFLQVDRAPTCLTASFAAAAHQYGLPFDAGHFVSFARIAKELASRVRKKKSDLIYAKCRLEHAEQICAALRLLPPQERPALLLSDSIRHLLDPEKFSGVKIAGFFDLDTPPYAQAARELIDAVRENRLVNCAPNREFFISPPR